jgi:DNA invertase Pin-like site-specific DNA recombinase
MRADTPIDFPRVRETLLRWPQSNDFGHLSYRKFSAVRGWRAYHENIDTTTPQGEMICTVMASLAQFESALISARVKAGMARARAQGKRIARAPLATVVQRRIATLYQQGHSIHQISKQLSMGYGTAWNDVQRVKENNLLYI